MIKFELTKEQSNLVKQWQASHDCKLRTDEYGIKNEIYVGPIGGSTEYIFIPTSIGNICKVRCTCGAELDLTDYEDW